MVLAAAPKIEICCSFWESFSFTPKTPSDLTVYITRMAQRIYILSYNENTTRQNEYRVTSALKGWIVEELQCSPTSFVHDRQIDKIRKVQVILDQNHHLSLTSVRPGVKVAECMAVCGLLFSALFTGHQIYHRRYSWKLVALVAPAALLVASLILLKNTFRRANAIWNSAKLITVVDYARKEIASIGYSALLHTPSEYQ